MKLILNGQEHELEPENMAILHYPNDIMDGLYIDLTDTEYAFLHAHDPQHSMIITDMRSLGVEEFDMTEMADIDLSKEPHAWVIDSIAKSIVAMAESLLDG